MRVKLLEHSTDSILYQLRLIDGIHILCVDDHLCQLEFAQRTIRSHIDTELGLGGKIESANHKQHN